MTGPRIISILDIHMDETLKQNAERLGCPVEALTALLDAHKAWERDREVPAWVEQLASEWEMKGAANPRALLSEDTARMNCAAELRERAKAKP